MALFFPALIPSQGEGDKMKREANKMSDSEKSVDFFFDMMNSSVTKFTEIEKKVRFSKIPRIKIAKMVAEDKDSGVKSVDSAVRLIRDLMQTRDSKNKSFVKSLKKVLNIS